MTAVIILWKYCHTDWDRIEGVRAGVRKRASAVVCCQTTADARFHMPALTPVTCWKCAEIDIYSHLQTLSKDVLIWVDYAFSALETIFFCLMDYTAVLSNSNSGNVHAEVSSLWLHCRSSQSNLDYESVLLVTRYLASNRPFSQSFDIYLTQVVIMWITKSQTHKSDGSIFVTRDLHLLTPKWVSQDLSWNISVWSLVILAASVFEITCGKMDR